MRWYDASQKPFSVHGLAVNGEDGRFWRMPPEVIDTVSPAVSELARCAVGGRVRFRTDARRLCVRYAIKACSPDILMSPAASLG